MSMEDYEKFLTLPPDGIDALGWGEGEPHIILIRCNDGSIRGYLYPSDGLTGLPLLRRLNATRHDIDRGPDPETECHRFDVPAHRSERGLNRG
jgi:hypothetical protein